MMDVDKTLYPAIHRGLEQAESHAEQEDDMFTTPPESPIRKGTDGEQKLFLQKLDEVELAGPGANGGKKRPLSQADPLATARKSFREESSTDSRVRVVNHLVPSDDQSLRSFSSLSDISTRPNSAWTTPNSSFRGATSAINSANTSFTSDMSFKQLAAAHPDPRLKDSSLAAMTNIHDAAQPMDVDQEVTAHDEQYEPEVPPVNESTVLKCPLVYNTNSTDAVVYLEQHLVQECPFSKSILELFLEEVLMHSSARICSNSRFTVVPDSIRGYQGCTALQSTSQLSDK